MVHFFKLFNHAITQLHKYMSFWPKMAKIGSIRARDIILEAKSIYLCRGIQWYIYKNPKSTDS